MKKVFFLITLLLMMSAQADAAKIEAYQKILESGRYTIHYENLTPAPRVTNRNVVELYGKNGLAAEGNEFFINRPLSGIIVSDGDNRYEEVGYKDFFQCLRILFSRAIRLRVAALNISARKRAEFPPIRAIISSNS